MSTHRDHRPSAPRWLLLSAYQSQSHAYWVAWLQRAFSDIDWRVLTLPGRHFRWRIRGNPLSWVDRLEAAAEGIDGVLATSMVDLATLRGLCPALCRVPNVYYFHENQFAYPVGANQNPSVEPQIVQLYGALAADRLVFNSGWNKHSFLDGVGTLLGRMPDAVPSGIQARLAPRCSVIPVPVDPIPPAPDGTRDRQLIVWNHRWEYDKAPDRFAEAMRALAGEGAAFRLALLGPRPARPPEALAALTRALGSRIIANGHVDRRQYESILARAGFAVSTTLHEFQGLGMLEAVSAGAIPVVPDALVYPEQYPEAYRYPAGDTDALVQRLDRWLSNPPAPPAIDPWLAEAVTPAWRALLELTL